MKMTLRSKVLVISFLLLFVPSLVIGLSGYSTAKSSLDDSGVVALKNLVRMTSGMIDSLQKEVDKGTLSLEDAQERVKIHILGEKTDGKRPINKKLDIGKNGYFFILDKEGTLLAHPSLEGENLWDKADVDGFLFVRDMIEKGDAGGGLTYYQWGLPDNPDKVAPKISYTEVNPHWGWYISAGSYMEDYNNGANRVLDILLVTLGASLLVGMVIILLFSHHLAKPLQLLTKQVQLVSSGHLDVNELRISNRDEIGTLASSVNQMTANLREMIGQVSITSEQVAATSQELSASSEETSLAAEEISTAIQEISQRVELQIRSTEQMSAVVSEISTGIEHVSHSIQEVSESSSETAAIARMGNQVVSDSVEQMNQINVSRLEMEKVIQVLGQKSEQIGNVISLITNIAAQTNLLALNAAIEAARAGEHGRGFAVVADEVRKLAEESSRAGGQVHDLILDIQLEVGKTVEAMERNGHAIGQGLNLVNQAGKAFEEITSGVDQVSEQIQTISAAIQEMNASTETLLHTAYHAEQATRESEAHAQNVAASAEEQHASMEEISSAAETLAKMAENLQSVVNRFKL